MHFDFFKQVFHHSFMKRVNDNSWRLDFCGVDAVESGCLLFSDVPPSLGSTEVEFILNVFQMNNVCLGNPDYPAVVKAREWFP